MAHVKYGELLETPEMAISSQVIIEKLLKVQRLGIETKFLPMRKYVGNIPKSAVLIYIINDEDIV